MLLTWLHLSSFMVLSGIERKEMRATCRSEEAFCSIDEKREMIENILMKLYS